MVKKCTILTATRLPHDCHLAAKSAVFSVFWAKIGKSVAVFGDVLAG